MSLFLFDIDGTVVRSFMREGKGGARATAGDYDTVEVLPGRRELLDRLRADGHRLALVTNQGGVAFGYQTVPQVLVKLGRVLGELGFDPYPVPLARESHYDAVVPAILGRFADPRATFVACFVPEERGKVTSPPHAYVSMGHPNAKVSDWRDPEGFDWRKPGGGMIRQALADYGSAPEHATMVGDMDSDRLAAEAAGVAYIDAAEFFA